MTVRLRRNVAVLVLVLLPLVGQAAAPSREQIEQRVDTLLQKLTLGEKIDLLGGVDDFYIRDNNRIGLPRLKMADGPIGVRNYGPATTFGGIGLAATWDTELARKIGTVIGQDARARGVHFMLGPGVNIYRAPMCGRNFEYFGEDPYLASRTAVSYIEGMQSQGVSATIKHFAGNNQEYDRHNVDSVIDERTLHEIYLPAFEAAVKEAHVGAIMDSYNLTNGLHATESPQLNVEIAKREWAFEGITMSDWDATYDGVAAANSGLDLEMPAGKHMNRDTLLAAVQSGRVSQATIDDKVRRILRTAFRFGWLDHEQTDLSIPVLNMDGRRAALEAARSGMVLLKNTGDVLPLDKRKIKSLAVIGPDAYPAQPVGGGSAGVQPFAAVSYLEGLSTYLGGSAKVYYQRGLPTYWEMAGATQFSTDVSGREPGLHAEFFNNPELSGTPVARRTEQHINADHSFGDGIALNNVSARWTGYFRPSQPGAHIIFVQGPGEGGGYRLFVDDKPIISNWDRVNALVSQARVALDGGAHKIRFEYFVHQSWGGPSVRLGIVRPAALVNREAVEMASHADAAVVAVGFDPESESEGGDRTFLLPPGQEELINAIAATNKKTIVVVTSGGAVDVTDWLDNIPALLESWYAGQEGGTALAQLLFGDYSPSGKLPISWERRWQDNAVYASYYPQDRGKQVKYSEGVFLGYRHFDRSGIEPLFPFGYGLSYTTFSYKNLSVSPATLADSKSVTVSFDVTNVGHRAGAEVAEVYVGEQHAIVPRPVKELKGFAKVYLRPDESQRVSIVLGPQAFSYYDVAGHQWKADSGDFDLFVARSAAQIELQGKVVFHAH